MLTRFLVASLLLLALQARSQNLSSLIADRNINATFAIVAYDETEQEWGIAVATNNLYVGSSTVHIEPGVGAFSTIAETEPRYATAGLRGLAEGGSVEAVLESVRSADQERQFRQVAGLDADGNAYAFTGEALRYWPGQAGHRYGQHYVVVGNQLAAGVLDSMAQVFERSGGTLATRLLAGLLAGQAAGGQLGGKQSAALVVKGTRNEWFNQIDLRVDHSDQPFADLARLLNYHYGRIRLNQAQYALRAGNRKLAEQRLVAAEKMLTGWYGMYAKLALTQYAIQGEASAVKTILAGLAESPGWAHYLPAFYFLRHHPDLEQAIHPEDFSISDWQLATTTLLQLKQYEEAKTTAEAALQFPNAPDHQRAHSYWLLARVQFTLHDKAAAREALSSAVAIDPQHLAAKGMLGELGN